MYSVPPTSLIILAIRSSARRFLGYGFDRTRGRLLQMVLDNYPDTDIDVRYQNSIITCQIGESEQDTLTELQHSFGIKLGVNYNGISGGASIGAGSATKSKSYSKDVVCTFFHIQSAQCSFKNRPMLAAGKTINDLDIGDSFVEGGRVYVGYYINITLHTSNNTQENETSSHIAGDISYLPLLHLGAKREEIERFLNGRQVTSVTMDVRGFGGYNPKIGLLRITNLELAASECERIGRDFATALPTLQDWEMDIDPTQHIGNYTVFTPSRSAPPPSLPIYDLPPMPPPAGFSDQISWDESLANGICALLSDEDRKALDEGNVSLSIMLKTIKEVFLDTVEQIHKHQPGKKAILFLGRSGIGKSSAIASLLGYELVQKQLKDGSLIIDYKTTGSGCPTLGHDPSNSKTKGCYLYTNPDSQFEYIDCAGALDPQGIEADICNAMAIAMFIQHVRPAKIIIVCRSDYILVERAAAFISVIERLSRCLRYPTDLAIWPSIIFLVNDRLQPGVTLNVLAMRNLILTRLEGIANFFQGECNRLMPPTSTLGKLWSSISGNHSNTNSLDETISDADKQKARRVIELKGKKRIVDLLRQHAEHNLVVANLLDPSARISVLKILDATQEESLPNGIFTPEHLYEDKISQLASKFNTVFSMTVSYFNVLITKKNNSIAAVTSLNERLHVIRGNIDQLESDRIQLDTNQLSPVNPRQVNILEINKQLGVLNEQNPASSTGKYKERHDLEVRKQVLKAKILELRNDMKPYRLPPIGPTTPITPRSIWAIPDCWAFEYIFKYQDIPFLSAHLQIPPGREHDASAVITKIYQPDQGVYEANYLPEYNNHNEDCNVVAIVEVRAKDHFSTHASIRELEAELEGFNERLKTVEAAINGLLARQERLRSNVLTELQENSNTLIKERETTVKELRVNTEKLAELTSIITSYSDFCTLLVNMISNFKLNTQASTVREREIFAKFITNYPILTGEPVGNSKGKRERATDVSRESNARYHVEDLPPVITSSSAFFSSVATSSVAASSYPSASL